jgi:hypothetical protein
MRAELAALDEPGERRRFALSCTRVALGHSLGAPQLWRPIGVFLGVVAAIAAEIGLTRLVGDLVSAAIAVAAIVWLGGRPGHLGPVRSDSASRAVRATGLLVVGWLLVVAAIPAPGADGNGFWSKLFAPAEKPPAFVLVLTAWAALVSAATARGARSGGTALAVGGGFGLLSGAAGFVVLPFLRTAPPLVHALPGHGQWLALLVFGAPLAAAALTGRRTRRGDQAVIAALTAAGTAALTVATLGLSVIALLPGVVPDTSQHMLSTSTLAERHAESVIEAVDPYAGLLLLAGLLLAPLWVMARRQRWTALTALLLILTGIPPLALCLSATNFPGITGITATVAMLIVSALLVTRWSETPPASPAAEPPMAVTELT